MHGTELNRRTVESLIKAGAFDNLGSNRRSLVEATEGVLKSIESDSRKNLDGQIDLFSMMSGTDNTSATDSYEIKPCPEYTHAELLQQEKEVSGLYLSGHPLDAYREQSAQFATHTIKALTGEDANVPDNSHVRIVCTIVKSKMVTTKTNSMMAYTSVEDLTGTIEVIVFPRTLETFRDVLHDNAVVVIEAACLSERMNLPVWSPRVFRPLRAITPSGRRPTALIRCGMQPGGSTSGCPPAPAGVRQGGQFAGDF